MNGENMRTKPATGHHHGSLKGKFMIVHDDDHEHFRTGEIIAEVGQGLYYLVLFDQEPPRAMKLCGLDEMTHECEDCGTRAWLFFDTRQRGG
jgi:hypothetical protein